MQYVRVFRDVISQQNFWNILLLAILFPIYLYIIQTSQQLFSILGIGGFLIFMFYLIFLYRYKVRSYQIPLHFIIASILFMQVIKGDTVPLAVIVIVLGLGLFFVQDIISHKEYKNSEFMRQIILSGIVFMAFATYAFLFGSIFIVSISPIILSMIAFIATFNITLYTLWMYNIEKQYYRIIAGIASIIIVQLFIGIRILPFTHLTQSMILTIYLIFSLTLVRDIYLKHLNRNKLLSRFALLLILIGVLIFTSLT